MSFRETKLFQTLKGLKATANKHINSADEKVIAFFALNGFLASLYYFVFSTKFYREHKSVLIGRRKYKKSLREIGESCVLLRRNVHRLEKGIIMRPRREIFAQGYIGETVDCYRDSIKSDILCDDEKKWATEVLRNYFDIVGESAVIDKYRNAFYEVAAKQGTLESVPYEHKTLPECDVSSEQLFNLYKRRRSVRWYQDKPVEMEKIQQAIDAATLAPSACNRQPYKFFVANEKDRAVEIAKCAMGTAGWVQNIPCTIVVVGDLSAYPKERDRHVIYIDGSLAAMQLMLAFEPLGLSTCPINWPDIEGREKMMQRKLGLKDNERPIMLISVGYADNQGGVPFSQKKTSKILLKET